MGMEDVGIVIELLPTEKFTKLHESLVKAGFECIEFSDAGQICDYLKNDASVSYVRRGTSLLQMELKFARNDVDEYQIKTRKKLPLTGTDFFFPSVESAIAFREELSRSVKDVEEAQQLRLIYGTDLNESEIEKVKREIRRLKL
jgi:hypothetical protein